MQNPWTLSISTAIAKLLLLCNAPSLLLFLLSTAVWKQRQSQQTSVWWNKLRNTGSCKYPVIRVSGPCWALQNAWDWKGPLGWAGPAPLLKQVHLELVAQDRVHTALEYFQGWRSHSLSRQTSSSVCLAHLEALEEVAALIFFPLDSAGCLWVSFCLGPYQTWSILNGFSLLQLLSRITSRRGEHGKLHLVHEEFTFPVSLKRKWWLGPPARGLWAFKTNPHQLSSCCSRPQLSFLAGASECVRTVPLCAAWTRWLSTRRCAPWLGLLRWSCKSQLWLSLLWHQARVGLADTLQESLLWLCRWGAPGTLRSTRSCSCLLGTPLGCWLTFHASLMRTAVRWQLPDLVL